MRLEDFGWTASRAKAVPEGLSPARVVADFGTSVKLVMPEPVAAELSGKLAHYADKQMVPKVGDWVAARRFDNGDVVVETVLPRESELARKTTGNVSTKQVIATNVDIAFVLLALDNDFSVERLERYLYQLSVSHIEPVIVLNKADKTDDLASYTDQLQALPYEILITEARSGIGVETILGRITSGKTALLLGSSGVGKSTLTNQLLGRDLQATQQVRERDDTGRHTTVHRELFVLPNGGLLIDTPGIRELQLWGTPDELAENFEDIVTLEAECKYANCRHQAEPGCAVRPALEDGTIAADHYARYLKMRQELNNLAERTTERGRKENRRSAKSLKRRNSDSLRD